MSDQMLLILLIAAALMYDFVNGFHDAANAIATTVATHAMSPRNAIIMARTLNFAGGLVNTAVAYTIGKGVVESSVITMPMLVGATLGAVLWGYTTWYYGLPSSSTHALVGGLIGVSLWVMHFDTSILVMAGVKKILWAMLYTPFIGMFAAMGLTILLSWLAWRSSYRKSAAFFKKTQILSAAYVAFSHGMNDAQNSMGIISVGLLASGVISEFHVPLWVRVVSAFVIGLGTSVGGWRIIRTMGSKMTKLHEPLDGCAAETAAGTVMLVTSLAGIPISTSQTATSAIAGTAMAYRFGNVRWSVIRNIVIAWVLTFAGAGIYGVLVYSFLKPFLP